MRRYVASRIVYSLLVLLLVGSVVFLNRHPSPSQSIEGPLPPVASETPKPLTNKSPEQDIEGGNKFGALSTLSAAPIEFYGKVIDQDGNALPNVSVNGGTGSTTGFMHRETRVYTTSTDGGGLFSFADIQGDVLNIGLKKEGYNFESQRNTFHYSPIDPEKKRFTPERDNPVVFTMWKSAGPVALINYFGRSVRLPVDGTPVKVDLAKGEETKSGEDLLISVKWGARTDQGSYAFDWSAKIEAPEGGLIEGVGDAMFAAPLDGYRRSFEYHFKADQREGGVERIFYVKSRNGGAYSRVEISLQNVPTRGTARATLRVLMNPSGSRNLERDPTKRVPGY